MDVSGMGERSLGGKEDQIVLWLTSHFFMLSKMDLSLSGHILFFVFFTFSAHAGFLSSIKLPVSRLVMVNHVFYHLFYVVNSFSPNNTKIMYVQYVFWQLA